MAAALLSIVGVAHADEVTPVPETSASATPAPGATMPATITAAPVPATPAVMTPGTAAAIPTAAASSQPSLTPALQPARHPSAYSIGVEPMLLFFTTAGLVFEKSVIPRVSVAATVGFGSSNKLTYGDRVQESWHGDSFDDLQSVEWTRAHAGLQGNFYFDHAFRGPHVGAEASYKQYWPDENGAGGDVAVVTGSAYGGWKWVTLAGFTAVLQFGTSIVGMRGDTDSGDWSMNSNGTLKTVHLYGKLVMGWSF